ncbi:hypothetical protein BASA50_006348 [Batrachochytrium salamandrivorans]|uniref:Homeobox domain-containing protein n=1 Tax=Batrachochytrium salamandrivorans TaxID=1357716 RepID=A0ABQ8FCU6_9FUNG|nr:hypothetical protein BASA62_006417 [Batrachochytrium salamandrivorans]KAH6575726.1 hypothetical protein BASA60_004871 [Batrachochytrium salamandrivorans]KAH6594670.1 hypothetical protein BASA50_006348 [Batrachochytrium salamandrivorans]KAH6599952.1 hypothetical protein BASA61_002419 [Batrachochytrium salamandrivorans]KAH9276598.1 hypothetical protein BASA83_000727 [Batrachochytrium salamandrivorans]
MPSHQGPATSITPLSHHHHHHHHHQQEQQQREQQDHLQQSTSQRQKQHASRRSTPEISSAVTPVFSTTAMAIDRSDTNTVVSNGSAPSVDGSQLSNGISTDRRRVRRRIEGALLEKLTEFFWVNDRPSWEERRVISDKVGMSNRDVQVWFQNRRAKERRLATEGVGRSHTNPPSPALSQGRQVRTPSRHGITRSATAINTHNDHIDHKSTMSPSVYSSPLARAVLPDSTPQQTYQYTPTPTYMRTPYGQLQSHKHADSHWALNNEQRRSRASSSPLPPTTDLHRIPLHSSPTAQALPAIHMRSDYSDYSPSYTNDTLVDNKQYILMQPFQPTMPEHQSPLARMDDSESGMGYTHHAIDQSVRQLAPIPFVGSGDESHHSTPHGHHHHHDSKLAPMRKQAASHTLLDMSTMLNSSEADDMTMRKFADDMRDINEAAYLLLSIKQ